MSYDGQRICAVSDAMGAEQTCAFPRPASGPCRIGWWVTGLLPGFAEANFLAAAREAFGYWAEVANLEAIYFDRSGDAMAAFNAGKLQGLVVIETGAIDGPSGTLAWSELPCGVRRVKQRYDTGEAWTVAENPFAGKIDLVRVMAHELGHALGLPHIANGNLLQPYYSGSIRKPQTGDIAEIRRRYGPRQATPTPPTTPGGIMGGLGTLIDILSKLKPLLDLWNDPAFQQVLAKIIAIFGNKQSLTADDVDALKAELDSQVQQMRAP